MRASISDLEALSLINPIDVSAYLTSHGWRKVQDISDISSIWNILTNRKEFELFLPQKTEYRDFPVRMFELLKMLESVEDRSQIEILDDIKTAQIHVIRVRVDNPEIIDGTIRMYDGVQLFDSTKRLMWSAAKSSEKPEPVLRGGGEFRNVKYYLNGLRFGKSEVGSYILKILSPSTFPERLIGLGDSFGDKVVRTLFESLSRISGISASLLDQNDLELIDTLVMTGISANLVDSLLSMNEISSNGNLDFSLSKAASYQKASEIPSSASIAKDDIPLLSEVSKRLKSKKLKSAYESKKQRLPRSERASQSLIEELVSRRSPHQAALPQAVSLEGTVTRLEWSGGNASPRVTISASLNEEMQEIVVEVSPDKFLMATKANIDNRSIACRGSLHVETGVALIREPTIFSII